MKFRLILLLLGWRLAWLARRHAGFRQQLVHQRQNALGLAPRAGFETLLDVAVTVERHGAGVGGGFKGQNAGH